MGSMVMGTDGFVWFIGKVENIIDPGAIDRVQVRCYGIHESDMSKLATEDLPWATVSLPTTSAGVNGIGQNHGLRPGSDVWGFFADGIKAQLPIVVGVISAASQGASRTLVQNIPGPSGVGINAEADPVTVKTLTNGAREATSTTPSEKTDQTNGATETTFSAQIGPGVVGSLTGNQVQAYKGWLAQEESSNRYNIANASGFLGKYQMGALSLIECGIVKSESISRNISDVAQNKLLNNPDVWTGKFGISSRSDFLTKGASQELAQDALIRKQYQYAVHFGCVNASSPPGAVAGYIAACHISLAAMIAVKNGGDQKDGNGTSAKGRFVAAKKVVESVT